MNGSTNNEVSIDAYGYLFLDVVITSKNPIDSKFSLVYQTTPNNLQEIDYEIGYLESQDTPYGIMKANETKRIQLKIYNNSANRITFILKIRSSLVNNEIEVLTGETEIKNICYQESLLNGTDPVLSDNLVPVIIEDNGTVRKASIKEEWYNYSKKHWANAVVLESKTSYSDGQEIPESNIESYFVWIPRYKYKLFDIGKYSSLVNSAEKKEKTIEVVFENKNVAPVVEAKVGDYHSHPAFQAFDTNGFWVGKFESGYKGATSTTSAQQNNNNSTNLVIKPNVYSWRSITVGNAFKASYDYLREDESHMMKNTEWGAVAYLQHSDFGSRTSVRVNNNTSYLTGYAAISEPTCGQNANNTSSSCNLNGTASSVTRAYNTSVGYTASTTGNISGIYDMSGGAWEYVMGYNMEATTAGGSSGLTSIYNDFFTNNVWDKYYDHYYNVTGNKRILGDATGEMGPFASIVVPDGTKRFVSSWYNDMAGVETLFITPGVPFFVRGGMSNNGNTAGIFSYRDWNGSLLNTISFRTILNP